MTKFFSKLTPTKPKKSFFASQAKTQVSNIVEYPPLSDTRLLSQKQQQRCLMRAHSKVRNGSAGLKARFAELDAVILQQQSRLDREKGGLDLSNKTKDTKKHKRRREHTTSPRSPAGKKAPHICDGDSEIDCFDLVCPARALNKSF